MGDSFTRNTLWVTLIASTVWNAERPEESIQGLEKGIGSTKCDQLFPKLFVKKYTYQFPKSTEK